MLLCRNASALSRRVLVLSIKVITPGDTFSHQHFQPLWSVQGCINEDDKAVALLLKSRKMSLTVGSPASTTWCLQLVTFRFQIHPNHMQELETLPTFGSEAVGLESHPECSGQAAVSYPSWTQLPPAATTPAGRRTRAASPGSGANALADPDPSYWGTRVWKCAGQCCCRSMDSCTVRFLPLLLCCRYLSAWLREARL